MIKNGKVLILENIVVDSNLPKYKKEENIDSSISVTPSFNPSIIIDDNVLDYLTYVYDNNPSLMLKFKIWLYKKFYMKTYKLGDTKSTKISTKQLKEFFDSVKDNIDEISYNNVNEILNKYSTILENAEHNNQIALIERITDYAETLKFELILSSSKFNKFLTEEDLVKFYNVASVHEKYKTGLNLTYVKNFIKVIPEDITNLKKEADELKVFDNYVILHYDYTGKTISDTKAEAIKRKDPILFGVIKNSKNLYYIGDWIDDYCDLTLDDIIKKLGKENILDKDTIINNINKI